MEKYAYWGVGILVLLGFINSCNSSNKYKEVNTLHPYTPLRAAYTYVGGCYCPYDLDSRGYECGTRSAWYRPGGDRPMCYLGDKYGYPPNRRG